MMNNISRRTVLADMCRGVEKPVIDYLKAAVMLDQAEDDGVDEGGVDDLIDQCDKLWFSLNKDQREIAEDRMEKYSEVVVSFNTRL